MNTLNTWTPNKLNIAPVNWTAERTRSYRIGGGCKQSLKANVKGLSRTSYKR